MSCNHHGAKHDQCAVTCKSKTGSAKGGDGKRLGEQLQRLQNFYGGGIYYHALIGNTLKGHRSKGAVEKAAPTVVVLVGNASFQELTASQIGPQLLLRVYQTAFTIVSRRSGYLLDTMAAGIVSTFRERAFDSGDGFLEVILKGVTSGPKEDQLGSVAAITDSINHDEGVAVSECRSAEMVILSVCQSNVGDVLGNDDIARSA